MCANAGIVEAGRFLGVDEGAPKKPNMKTLDIDLNGTLYCKPLLPPFTGLRGKRKRNGTDEEQRLNWRFIICGKTPRRKRV